MPNHVTHRLNVKAPTKEAMDHFLAGICTVSEEDGSEGSLNFSFEMLIPMPRSIRETESSSSVNHGLIILGREDLLRDSIITGEAAAQAMLSYPWVISEGVTTIEELRVFLAKRSPDAVEAAKKAIIAHEETGHISWYEWSIANWGTKWGAYGQSITRKSDTEALMIFDTAWGCPEPVLHAMAEKFPDIEIHGYAFDEGWGFAVDITMTDGCCTIADVPPSDEIYEIVYGEPPELDEDEDEAEAAE